MELCATTLLSLPPSFPAVLVSVVSAQNTCGSIGSSDKRELNGRTDRRFYLDANNPATCTGTVTNWRVCFYGPDNLRMGSYWATYAVYRRVGSGGNERYQRVSQIFSAVRATSNLLGNGVVDGTLQEDNFACYDDSIDSGDLPVIVQAGDVLGACIFNPDNLPGDNRRQLDIVGETDGSSLLEMNDDECTTEAIPSDIPTSQLSNRNNRRLHLFANIGMTNLMVVLLNCVARFLNILGVLILGRVIMAYWVAR